MMRELIVNADWPAAAARVFLEVQPHTIALAGGSTPAELYRRLALIDYQWSATEVFFGDERCVPPTDSASNFRMADETLLSNVPAKVHRMRGEICDAAGYETELVSIFGPGVPVFDLVFLGLGSDGHTASLFPGDPALTQCERRVAQVQRPDHDRLTLTLPVLSAAKVVVFLVAGQDKATALKRLHDGADIPAARVQAQRVVVVADEAAAGLISGRERTATGPQRRHGATP